MSEPEKAPPWVDLPGVRRVYTDGAGNVLPPRLLPEDDEFLTTEEMAKWLRVHPVTILEAARKGQIPGRKVGRSWRFLRSEIREYLKGPPTLAELKARVQAILETLEKAL